MMVSDLMIELTRTCNMVCSHCIRGKSQKEELTKEMFVNFIERTGIKYVGTLMFTGGEPSLKADIISFIIEYFNKKNIQYESFYIATNGVKNVKTFDFVSSVAKLYEYAQDKERCQLSLSRDDYHLENDMDTAEELLSAFSFTTIENYSEYYLFDDGFAKGNPMATKTYELSENEISIYDDKVITTEPLYLSATGGIGLGCNFSYERFDKEIKFADIEDIENEDHFLSSLKQYALDEGMEVDFD